MWEGFNIICSKIWRDGCDLTSISHIQAVLTSATLSEDVTRLKKLVLNNPVVLKLSEPQLPDSSQLTQYVIKLEEEEKFVLIYALFKLELIRGKSLMFVSSVDRSGTTWKK